LQNFGELDPYFIAAFYEQLGKEWEIYDPKGVPHNVEFNRSITKPLITIGWDSLRTFYRWPGNQKLSFFYYGRNKFLMIVSDHSRFVIPTHFPSFHTMSTEVGDYRYFFISVGDEVITATTLVGLQMFKSF
jgi:hypothetical protein